MTFDYILAISSCILTMLSRILAISSCILTVSKLYSQTIFFSPYVAVL